MQGLLGICIERLETDVFRDNQEEFVNVINSMQQQLLKQWSNLLSRLENDSTSISEAIQSLKFFPLVDAVSRLSTKPGHSAVKRISLIVAIAMATADSTFNNGLFSCLAKARLIIACNLTRSGVLAFSYENSDEQLAHRLQNITTDLQTISLTRLHHYFVDDTLESERCSLQAAESIRLLLAAAFQLSSTEEAQSLLLKIADLTQEAHAITAEALHLCTNAFVWKDNSCIPNEMHKAFEKLALSLVDDSKPFMTKLWQVDSLPPTDGHEAGYATLIQPDGRLTRMQSDIDCLACLLSCRVAPDGTYMQLLPNRMCARVLEELQRHIRKKLNLPYEMMQEAVASGRARVFTERVFCSILATSVEHHTLRSDVIITAVSNTLALLIHASDELGVLMSTSEIEHFCCIMDDRLNINFTSGNMSPKLSNLDQEAKANASSTSTDKSKSQHTFLTDPLSSFSSAREQHHQDLVKSDGWFLGLQKAIQHACLQKTIKYFDDCSQQGKFCKEYNCQAFELKITLLKCLGCFQEAQNDACSFIQNVDDLRQPLLHVLYSLDHLPPPSNLMVEKELTFGKCTFAATMKDYSTSKWTPSLEAEFLPSRLCNVYFKNITQLWMQLVTSDALSTVWDKHRNVLVNCWVDLLVAIKALLVTEWITRDDDGIPLKLKLNDIADNLTMFLLHQCVVDQSRERTCNIFKDITQNILERALNGHLYTSSDALLGSDLHSNCNGEINCCKDKSTHICCELEALMYIVSIGQTVFQHTMSSGSCQVSSMHLSATCAEETIISKLLEEQVTFAYQFVFESISAASFDGNALHTLQTILITPNMLLIDCAAVRKCLANFLDHESSQPCLIQNENAKYIKNGSASIYSEPQNDNSDYSDKLSQSNCYVKKVLDESNEDLESYREEDDHDYDLSDDEDDSHDPENILVDLVFPLAAANSLVRTICICEQRELQEPHEDMYANMTIGNFFRWCFSQYYYLHNVAFIFILDTLS